MRQPTAKRFRICNVFVLLLVFPLLAPPAYTQKPSASKDSNSAALVSQLVSEAPQIGFQFGFPSDDVQISPDGSWIVYTVARGSITTNEYVTELYLQHLTREGTADGAPKSVIRRVTGDKPASFAPRWNPRSDSFAYFDDSSDRNQRPTLVRYSLATSNTDPITLRNTNPGATQSQVVRIGEDYEWSPNGNFIAFTAPLIRNDLDTRRGVSIEPGRSWNRSSNALFLLNVASGDVTQLTPESLRVIKYFGWSWAPDEHAVVFSATPYYADPVWPIYTDVFVIDRTTRAVRGLVVRPGADLLPVWSPDGKRIAFLTSNGKQDGANLRLAMISEAGGEITYLTSERDPAPSPLPVPAWTQDSRNIIFSAAYNMNYWLFRATAQALSSPASGSPPARLLGDSSSYNNCFSFSLYARRVALIRSMGASPSELYVSTLSGHGFGIPRQITQLNAAFPLRDAVRVDIVRWPSPDGLMEDRGVLLTPTEAWQQDRIIHPLPTVVNLKCFGLSAYAVLGCAFEELPLAARGYAVLNPELRGNGGSVQVVNGATLYDLRNYMHTPNEDALAGIDLLIQRGIADAARLGVYGYSQGGARTSGMVTMTDRFKAAVVTEAAVDDWEGNFVKPALYHSNDPEWKLKVRIHLERGDLYDAADRARMEAESPAMNLNRVHTPTLLLFGAHSMAPSVGRIFFGGLQRFGIPSELVVYDEGHVFFRPAARADSLTRTAAWFDYWLRDVPYTQAERQREYDAWKQTNRLKPQ